MKATKMEKRIVSLTLLVLMSLVFLEAVNSKQSIDILYLFLMLFCGIRLVYVKVWGKMDDIDDSY